MSFGLSAFFLKVFCITRASTHLTVQNVVGVLWKAEGKVRERDLHHGGSADSTLWEEDASLEKEWIVERK